MPVGGKTIQPGGSVGSSCLQILFLRTVVAIAVLGCLCPLAAVVLAAVVGVLKGSMLLKRFDDESSCWSSEWSVADDRHDDVKSNNAGNAPIRYWQHPNDVRLCVRPARSRCLYFNILTYVICILY